MVLCLLGEVHFCNILFMSLRLNSQLEGVWNITDNIEFDALHQKYYIRPHEKNCLFPVS